MRYVRRTGTIGSPKRGRMSVLPDVEIRAYGAALISPFNPECVQPASYDLTLSDKILVPVVNKNRTPETRLVTVDKSDGFTLAPHACVLGSTVETVRVPGDLVARVEGKSSLGRLFIAAHVTAGWIDAGFEGELTLEIVNHGPWDVTLRPGMRIAQVNFTKLTQSCERPYGSPGLGSHYQNQRGPTAGASQDDE